MKSLDEYYDSPMAEAPWSSKLLVRIGKLLVGNGTRLLFRAKYVNLEVFDRIEDGKAVIVAGNHSSYTDPMFVYDAMWPRRIRFMAKGQLFEHKFLDRILAIFGVFPVFNDARGRKAIKRSIACLKRGENVGIFPEGTRVKTHDKTGVEYNDGVALIAKMADVLIVPVGIEGTIDISPNGSKFIHFPKVTLRFGEPIDWKDWADKYEKSELFAVVTDEVMKQVRALTDGTYPNKDTDSSAETLISISDDTTEATEASKDEVGISKEIKADNIASLETKEQ